MFPSQIYLDKLRTALLPHSDLHCYRELIRIIDGAATQRLNVEQLNNQLRLAMSRKSKWSRVKNALIPGRKNRKNEDLSQLSADLELAMVDEMVIFTNSSLPSRPSPRSIPLSPKTPDEFERTLLQRQLEHLDLDFTHQTKINNAIVKIKNDYISHHKALEAKDIDPFQATFHQKRLQVIWDWTTTETFGTLIDLIKKTNSTFSESQFSLSLDEKDFHENILENQHLLNWLGIIFDEFKASEIPYAMSGILRICALFESAQIDVNNIMDELDFLKGCYICDNSKLEINISSVQKREFLKHLETARLSQFEQDLTIFSAAVPQLKQSLINIYKELSKFIIQARQVDDQLHNLSSTVDLDHPSNRSSERSHALQNDCISSGSSSTKSSATSLSVILSQPPSRRKSSRTTLTPSSSLDQVAAMLVESNESSKSVLTP